MSTSRWRILSREVIQDVLKNLPPDATDAAKRAAIREAYPFGPRQYHPYKCWLAEVKAALGALPGDDPLSPEVWVKPGGIEGPVVVCGWCRIGVCLACIHLRRALQSRLAVTDWARWRHWLHLTETDATALGPFSDWLEENGWPEEAARVRRGIKT